MAAQPRRILVGVDGSEASWRALDTAIRLTGYGSSLTVVTVAPEGGSSSAETIARARERVRSHQLPASYVERVGEPALALLEAARELAVELVVVGRSGKRPDASAAPGSVSAAVVQGAPCDVLVVS